MENQQWLLLKGAKLLWRKVTEIQGHHVSVFSTVVQIGDGGDEEGWFGTLTGGLQRH